MGGELAPSRSNSREIPFKVLPRIIPRSGIAYWGEYQGLTGTIAKSATEVIIHELAQTETMLQSHTPG